MSPSELTLRLFGGFRLEIRGEEIRGVPRPAQEVIANLTVAGEVGVERNQLASLVWPEVEAERGRFYLRRCLTQLRTVLGSERERLVTTSDGKLRLNLFDASVDVTDFVQGISAKDEDAVKSATTLYVGPFLAGNRADWARQTRVHLRQLLVDGLLRLANQAKDSDDLDSAVQWIQKVVAEEPTREESARELMRLQAAKGDFAAAVRTLRDLRHRLRHAMGLPPSPETIDCYRELMAKGQMVNRSNPPLAPVWSAPGGLPSPLTSFLGREDDLQSVKMAIESHRLVTVTGFGGVGKSRIAIQAAFALSDQFEIVAYLDLSVCTDELEVPAQIVRALGISELGSTDPAELMALRLQTGSFLLVIDGIEKYRASLAELLEKVLPRCGGLHVMCTSRVLLQIPDEFVYALKPLDTLGEDSEAMMFLLERTKSASRSFTVNPTNRSDLLEICRRLDGLPLALELASVRLRSMPSDEILKGLEDHFQFLDRALTESRRHRTLQAVLDLSNHLLSPSESILFARLSVFQGGFSSHAAQAICGGDDLGQGQIPVLLGSLVDQSLVEFSPEAVDGRYRLLQTVRRYAREKLEEMPARLDDYLDRHAEHYLLIAAKFDHDPTCTERFKANEVNFSHAIQRLSNGQGRDRRLMAVKLVNRLFPYWSHTSNLYVGLTIAMQAIEKCGAGPDDALAECLLRAGGAAHVLYELPLADRLFEQTRVMTEELGLEIWTADAVRGRGEVAANMGRFDEAEARLREALSMYQEGGDQLGQAQCLGTVGYVARQQLRLDEARRLTEEASFIYTHIGNQEGRLWCAGSLGAIYVAAGQPELAVPLLQETLDFQRRSDNKLAQAWNLTTLGVCYARLKDYDMAERHVREAIEIRDVGENDLAKAWQSIELALILRATGRPSEAEDTLMRSLEMCRANGSSLLEGRALIGLSYVYYDRKDLPTARAYEAMASKIAESTDSAELVAELQNLATYRG